MRRCSIAEKAAVALDEFPCGMQHIWPKLVAGATAQMIARSGKSVRFIVEPLGEVNRLNYNRAAANGQVEESLLMLLMLFFRFRFVGRVSLGSKLSGEALGATVRLLKTDIRSILQKSEPASTEMNSRRQFSAQE